MGRIGRGASWKRAFRQTAFAAFAMAAARAFLPGLCFGETAWLLELQKFRGSVHGELSCLDCHDEIGRDRNHPSPAKVNQDPRERFQADRCAACHADEVSEAREGEHGQVALEAGQSFLECLGCHDPHADSAPSSRDRSTQEPAGQRREASCLSCHAAPAQDEAGAPARIAALCLCCHGGPDGKEESAGAAAGGCVPPDEEAWADLAHERLACTACHKDAAAYPHSGQSLADCRSCHKPHDEAVARHAHSRVSCAACHLEGGTPVREAKTGRILWQRRPEAGSAASIHRMGWPGGTEPCRRCHRAQNDLGAAASVLPAKGLACAPCHGATLSVSDWPSAAGLGLFCVGLLSLLPVWFSGRDRSGSAALSNPRETDPKAGAVLDGSCLGRLAAVAGSLLLDGLLQRRLFRASRTRWMVHGLIVFPILVRFVWGAVGLAASLLAPGWAGTRVFLDRDNPVHALLFDVTGLLVMVGVACLVLRRLAARRRPEFQGLPPPDRAGIVLLGVIFVAGFVLEGARMALAGAPQGSGWAFLGRLLSVVLAPMDWTSAYGVLWQVHALAVAAFAAYLPFSAMFHVFAAPLALALRAAAGYPSARESRKSGET